MTLSRFLSLGSLFVAAVSSGAQIDIPDWEHAITFELVASQMPMRPGDAFEIAVVADIEPGYHLYGPEEAEPSGTEVEVEGTGIEAGEPRFPPVVRRELAGLGTYDLYEGRIAIRVPVTLADDVRGEQSLHATVHYQVCTDAACSAPDSQKLTLTFRVAEDTTPQKLHPEIFSKK